VIRVAVLLLLAGCSHATIDGSKAHVESRPLAAIVVAGMFIAEFADWFRAPPRAELDPTRPVSEQDCTRPVELGGNLKCR
jgi:hypothetical protein